MLFPVAFFLRIFWKFKDSHGMGHMEIVMCLAVQFLSCHWICFYVCKYEIHLILIILTHLFPMHAFPTP